MRTRAERRQFRSTKIKQREEILKQSGFQGGLLYEKHVNKIKENGPGYMAKHGTLLHYVNGTNPVSQKIRDRDSHNGTNNWDPSCVRQMDSMDDQMDSMDDK